MIRPRRRTERSAIALAGAIGPEDYWGWDRATGRLPTAAEAVLRRFDAPTRVDSVSNPGSVVTGIHEGTFYAPSPHPRLGPHPGGRHGFRRLRNRAGHPRRQGPDSRHVLIQDIRILRRRRHGPRPVLHDHHEPPQAGDAYPARKQGIQVRRSEP